MVLFLDVGLVDTLLRLHEVRYAQEIHWTSALLGLLAFAIPYAVHLHASKAAGKEAQDAGENVENKAEFIANVMKPDSVWKTIYGAKQNNFFR